MCGRSAAGVAAEPMTDPQPLALVTEVARVLDGLAIPYAVGGSYASSLYGEPRFTRDADLIVGLSLDRVDALWRDILGIVRHMKGRLDEAYLAEWSQAIGVVDLLRRARDESERT